eukprot:comp10521_c0_seq1/m.12816 comp10521_c0_seq1/g.12816  ORF comp10521_c0_seq1/g.12816 comp10521_c0_seq1/m.12816 type:complete len:477 (+) comp10521_c0_seq1:779-2209(+)
MHPRLLPEPMQHNRTRTQPSTRKLNSVPGRLLRRNRRSRRHRVGAAPVRAHTHIRHPARRHPGHPSAPWQPDLQSRRSLAGIRRKQVRQLHSRGLQPARNSSPHRRRLVGHALHPHQGPRCTQGRLHLGSQGCLSPPDPSAAQRHVRRTAQSRNQGNDNQSRPGILPAQLLVALLLWIRRVHKGHPATLAPECPGLARSADRDQPNPGSHGPQGRALAAHQGSHPRPREDRHCHSRGMSWKLHLHPGPHLRQGHPLLRRLDQKPNLCRRRLDLRHPLRPHRARRRAAHSRHLQEPGEKEAGRAPPAPALAQVAGILSSRRRIHALSLAARPVALEAGLLCRRPIRPHLGTPLNPGIQGLCRRLPRPEQPALRYLPHPARGRVCGQALAAEASGNRGQGRTDSVVVVSQLAHAPSDAGRRRCRQTGNRAPEPPGGQHEAHRKGQAQRRHGRLARGAHPDERQRGTRRGPRGAQAARN